MDHSDSVQKIASALCKVQAGLKPLRRNADNPFFKSNYTDLAGMAEALYPLLAAEGLSVVQGGNGTSLDTLLLHTSGEWIETSLPMPAESNPQKLGSVVTYFRRYALAAIVGAVSEGEDDDGNAASHPTPRPASASSPAPRPAPSGPPPSTAPAVTVPSGGGSPAGPGDALEVTDLAVTDGVNKAGNPWKRWTATFSNNVKASTFDTKHGAMLSDAYEKGEPVIVQFQKSGNFTNIVGVELFPF